MRLFPTLALAFTLGAVPRAAMASACAESTEGPTVVLASPPWREAVAALRAATGDASQPWGCAGGTIDLVAHDGRATLIIATADGVVSRDVESPDDVVPLGEALLARPVEPAPKAAEIAPVAPPAPAQEIERPANPQPPRRDPRVLVSAIAAPRYAGRANMLLAGLDASVGLPLSGWVPALWVRFDGPIASLDGRDDASIMEFSAGGAFGRNFSAGIVDMRPSLTASVAAVIRPDQAHARGDTHADPRFGAEFRVALPRESLVRAVVSSDFEIAPLRFGHDDHPHDPTMPMMPMGPGLPELPSYTLGLGVGVEIAPR